MQIEMCQVDGRQRLRKQSAACREARFRQRSLDVAPAEAVGCGSWSWSWRSGEKERRYGRCLISPRTVGYRWEELRVEVRRGEVR